MIIVDKKSHVPTYEQIKNQLMTLILVGTYDPHCKLPSIRSVASDSGANISTVKKAIADLVSYGIIYTVPSKGCFVSDRAFSNITVKQNAISDLKGAITTAIAMGITKDEITNFIDELYDEVKPKDWDTRCYKKIQWFYAINKLCFNVYKASKNTSLFNYYTKKV